MYNYYVKRQTKINYVSETVERSRPTMVRERNVHTHTECKNL